MDVDTIIVGAQDARSENEHIIVGAATCRPSRNCGFSTSSVGCADTSPQGEGFGSASTAKYRVRHMRFGHSTL